MDYKYLNNYLLYKNSFVEKIGVKVVYDIKQKIFSTNIFLASSINKRISHINLFSTSKMHLYNLYISLIKILYPFFIYNRFKRYFRHRAIKYFNLGS